MRIKLDQPLSIKAIAAFANGIPITNPEKSIKHICTDTREIISEDLFVALKGENFDGNDFLEQAKNSGAITMGSRKTLCDVLVNDGKRALLKLASKYKEILNPKRTVAITGSVGKSTTKELTANILSFAYKVHKTEKNYNNDIGVPLTILSCPKGTDMLVIEAGMNNPKELSVLSDCIRPDICVITNIGSAHIGNLGSREMIAKSKMEITDCMVTGGKVIIPYEEVLLQNLKDKITVSNTSTNADFCLLEEEKGNFTFYKNGIKTFDFHLDYLGNHIPKCLVFALTVGIISGVNPEILLQATDNLQYTLSAEKLQIAGDLTIYDDSYNSSPEAVYSSLSTLSSMGFKYKSAVLGDMNELGVYTADMHRKIGAYAAKTGLEKIFTFGSYSEFIVEGALKEGFPNEFIFKNTDITNPEKTAKQVVDNCFPGEAVLFKASHSVNLGRIIKLIKDLKNS